MNELGNEIKTARVTFVFRGYGDLTLTDKMLYWNKSASSYIAFGIISTITENHISIFLSDIAKVETYMYITGGLVIITKTGQKYKYGFKRRKDFKVFYEYLTNVI